MSARRDYLEKGKRNSREVSPNAKSNVPNWSEICRIEILSQCRIAFGFWKNDVGWIGLDFYNTFDPSPMSCIRIG
jgi:hypothetical protein